MSRGSTPSSAPPTLEGHAHPRRGHAVDALRPPRDGARHLGPWIPGRTRRRVTELQWADPPGSRPDCASLASSSPPVWTGPWVRGPDRDLGARARRLWRGRALPPGGADVDRYIRMSAPLRTSAVRAAGCSASSSASCPRPIGRSPGSGAMVSGRSVEWQPPATEGPGCVRRASDGTVEGDAPRRRRRVAASPAART